MSKTMFDRRKAEMSSYLRRLAADATELAQKLDQQARRIDTVDETPEEPFSNGLQAVENFMRNINFNTAVSLAARTAAAEVERNAADK